MKGNTTSRRRRPQRSGPRCTSGCRRRSRSKGIPCRPSGGPSRTTAGPTATPSCSGTPTRASPAAATTWPSAPPSSRLLEDADAGRFDVVVVHKNDRFARNRRVAFDAFHRLGSAGVGFVSIVENMDYSTPAGQLMLTMLVGLSQFYSDNLSAETKKGKGERKRQGLCNGLLPFGVTTDSRGVPVLDRSVRYCDVATRREIVPADGLAPGLRAGCRRAIGSRDRPRPQRRRLPHERQPGQNPLTKDTVRPMLHNRFYVGELPDADGGWVPGKHGALIDPALFERAQAARAANTSRPRWVESKRQPWALSGVAVCGGCGANVNALSHSTGRRRIRCAGRTQGNGCDEPSCYADMIEDQIGDVLAGFAVPEEERGRLLAAWRYYQSRDTNASPSGPGCSAGSRA